MPCRSSFARELSSSNSRSDPSSGSTSSSSRRASSVLGDRARRERRREQHVVQRDGATPALARVLGRGKQLLRVAVRDDQLAFGVGQQDRVGDGVDDAVEQHPLLARLGQRLPAQEPRDLLGEQTGQPDDVRRGARVPRCSTSSSPCAMGVVVGPQRDRVKAARRPATGTTAADRRSRSASTAVQRLHERDAPSSSRVTTKSTMALLETPCSATSSSWGRSGSATATTACFTPVCAASQSMARRADTWRSTLDSRNSARRELRFRLDTRDRHGARDGRVHGLPFAAFPRRDRCRLRPTLVPGPGRPGGAARPLLVAASSARSATFSAMTFWCARQLALRRGHRRAPGRPLRSTSGTYRSTRRRRAPRR